MTRLKLFVALSTLGSLALTAVAFGGAAQARTSATIVSTKQTSLGVVLVNGSGETLYLDTGDKPPHFACTGSCLKAWPPLKAVGAIKVAGAAKSSLLGTTKGPGGKTVTYGGHPLYTFASDSKSSPTSGEGKNGFYAVSPTAGKVILPKKRPTGQVPGY